ncbi:hypothetical protein SAMN05444280_11883 [Tangfeifania diversioriginum]|uniref:Uncharacterized protein n=1 Tax=Tangfeifania diversioriginum TaxID=1168035 RepID=A0A1M6J272_9BACT|nr:hypothetical protein [Tangfeifania diversioriginum]SHJ40786.1 hypothetical protein SAMN05444280_11883 [Tangfeifania diversioriginum]
MKHKHLWIIFLAIQFFFVFQVKGQEQQKDTTSVPRSMKEKGDLQLQSVQPTPKLAMPELGSMDESFQGTPIDQKIASFNFNRELKYLNALNGDSSFMFLPLYPGLGDYQNFGGTLGSFNLSDKLALDYGAFISAQYGYLFSSKQIVLGSNFLLSYAITNKLQFQTWGQYVTPGNSSDPTFDMRTFFPTTNFGAGLQYDSNEKTKIKVGIEYQYDQSDKTWKPESGGKVLLKF